MTPLNKRDLFTVTVSSDAVVESGAFRFADVAERVVRVVVGAAGSRASKSSPLRKAWN
jgi:hypothetical protein